MPDVIYWNDSTIPEKTTPTTSDKIFIADAANSWATKEVQLGNLPFPAIEANTFSYKVWVTVGASHADYITDWVADDVQIQEAIDFVNSAGGGIVFLKDPAYKATWQIIWKDNVWVMWQGIDATTITGGIASWYVFYNSTSQTISNFRVSDLTIDNESVATKWWIWLNKASYCKISNVKFVNNAQFMLTFWANNAAWPIDCFNNTVEKCIFDNHSSTYEMFLLMNSSWTRITDCTFTNKTDPQPTLGLYQLCEYTTISNCHFIDNEGFVYYSLSTNNTKFVNCEFKNSRGIKGANLSDNGAFGETAVRDLSIINCTFEWGANSTNSTAIQLGATDSATIAFNTISEYNIGIVFDDWNTWVSVLPTNFKVIWNTFYNNTASNLAHSINNAILFSAIGWSCYGTIENNKFFDTQGTPTQRYPIWFTGAYTWDYIDIVGNRMSVYSWGTSIVLTSSAALGSNVNIIWNSAYSGSSPAQTASLSGTNTGDETTTRIGTLINGATEKTTPVDADMVGIMDSAASNILKKLSWVNIKATLKTYFDTLYVALTGNQTIAGDKTFSGKIISSNATSLEIANGGGSTPSAINIWSGGTYIWQVNWNIRMRSWFSSKNLDIMDSSSVIQLQVALDSGKLTFLTTSNKPAWTATLVAGTVTVNNTLVTASSIIVLTRITAGGTVGNLTYTRSAWTSFTINSDNAADTSTIWFIIFN